LLASDKPLLPAKLNYVYSFMSEPRRMTGLCKQLCHSYIVYCNSFLSFTIKTRATNILPFFIHTSVIYYVFFAVKVALLRCIVY